MLSMQRPACWLAFIEQCVGSFMHYYSFSQTRLLLLSFYDFCNAKIVVDSFFMRFLVQIAIYCYVPRNKSWFE